MPSVDWRWPKQHRPRWKFRRGQTCGFLVFLLLAFLFLATHPTTRTRVPIFNLPRGPTYFLLRQRIAWLPQHNLNLPPPEGKNGRYVKFSTEVSFLGWNNCLNERLMNAHLAYTSNRAYVFNDYWWANQHYQFPPAPEGGASTPFPALLGGPVVGEAWTPTTGNASAVSPYHQHPRSISKRWWEKVCPPARRRIFNLAVLKHTIPGGGRDAPGPAIFEFWQRLLSDAPESCVEVINDESVPGAEHDDFPQVFDLGFWGSRRLLDLWAEFAASPVSRLLHPSRIVESAIEKNLDAGVFVGAGRGFGGGRPIVSPSKRNPFERMLAVHLRRGDYIEHCAWMCSWGAGHYGWAQLDFLPDVANRRLPASDDPQREEKALKMCLPGAEDLVWRAAEVKREWEASRNEAETLESVYLLTNESGPFLEELVVALYAAGWKTIATTQDLRLNMEQTDVSVAVDMEIARRAAVFVGNGWSSFTSNVIHQRLASGKEPMSVRLL
ncbi:hypothetical protein HMN09_00817300 [Mycena chlorophos]|uniref:Uncharacterized protein n=1 Tax=Mycena chlorophos TaxID=658473 RepID=A0A8H6SWI7_MYCCL|nr:hypothetical protein HMN09_00817300 [Mycena chlorophos]